ncbi:protein LURP-one-related 7 isoform X2 [Impatiens glandulifera]|uniref:protein LURP-one-related 7 isoform X2 n=1 Tax=Impatiens glandulifera TaxID=253017 RepID=UPI001FB1112A|nr:protein LURP-one-related 7 isoform X2 [Impatiens glandulifera]
MELEVSSPQHLDSSHISIDLFVSKKHIGGGLRFTDASSCLVFQVQKLPSPGSEHRRVLIDAAGNPLICLHHDKDGSWKGYKGNGSEEKDMIFKVWMTVNSFSHKEFKVSIIGDENGSGSDSESGFRMKGSQFHRSFMVYNQNSIVAQSSLMHKLGIGKHFIPRSKFRLTIFPGFKDQAPLIVALTVIFFHGRRLWI